MIIQVCWRHWGDIWTAVIFGDYHKYELIEPIYVIAPVYSKPDDGLRDKNRTNYDW